MNAQQYLVVKNHQTEYPEPITFVQGTVLHIGEEYQGDEGWHDWFFCECSGQATGWVPRQVLRFTSKYVAVALNDYTAKELNVKQGDIVFGFSILNGWVWCSDVDQTDSGWVPLLNLQLI